MRCFTVQMGNAQMNREYRRKYLFDFAKEKITYKNKFYAKKKNANQQYGKWWNVKE